MPSAAPLIPLKILPPPIIKQISILELKIFFISLAINFVVETFKP